MYDYTVEKGIVQERGGREGETERGREGEVDGFPLMTPWFSKDIQCHV